MSKHFWKYKKLTEERKIIVRKLIDLARRKRFDFSYLSSDPDLTNDKASKAFAIYASERRCQDSLNRADDEHILQKIRESTLLKYSQYIPWLDEALDRS
jgi:hypothetical protein